MKKLLIVTVCVISAFCASIIKVNAFSGNYNYDINSISVSGVNFVITGWAVAKDTSGHETSNVQPTFKLQFVTDSGAVVLTADDHSYKPSYNGYYNAEAKDFTLSYYEQYAGFKHYSGYSTNYDRAKATLDSGNYMYINNHFTFEINIEGLRQLLLTYGRLRMNLTIRQNASSSVNIFGVNFSTNAINVAITSINAQEQSIDDSVKQLKVFKVMGAVNQVTALIVHGLIQKSAVLGANPIHGKYYGTGNTFDVINRNAIYNEIAKYTLYTYKVYYSLCGSNACHGSDYIGYIPATWVEPYNGGGIYLKSDECSTLPACNALTEDCPKACCSTLCSVPGNANSVFCKSRKTCFDPCKDITDATKQYCCKYPNSSKCDDYDEKDQPDTKSGVCKQSGVTKLSFVYPQQGWGKQLVSNTACQISCHEKLTATFQPQQNVRAGMGFTYPVDINSTRLCAAQYFNDSWKSKVDAAATSANNAYNNMVRSINNAKALDSACGTKRTLTSVPSCSCGTRSGYSCTGCTCSRRVFDHTESYSCGTAKAPRTCTRSVYRTEYYTCTKSASCPSGYSYRGSLDRCAKDVCNNNTSKTWSSAQSEISSQISAASSYRSSYNSYTSTVNSLKADRSTCDNYVSNNKYNGAKNTNVTTGSVPNQTSYAITSATSSDDPSYESSSNSTWTTYAIYQCNSRYYGAPYLVGDNSVYSFSSTYCNFVTANETYRDFWNKKSDASIKLEFAQNYYIQRYTGALSKTSQSGYDYHGRYAYTDFYAKSESTPFYIIATSLGPNLDTTKVSNTLWSINKFTCQYNVTNLIFPPVGDSQYTKYGNTAFMYRQISLTNPFPNRNPGENWSGKTNLITSNGYTIYGKTPVYTINLDPNTMQSIRGYGNNYGSYFVTDPNRSQFVEQYINNNVIIKNGR